MRLLDGYFIQGLNLTTDNFFTTYNRGKNLMAKNITLVGTIRRNRRELPPLIQPLPGQSLYFQRIEITLLNFDPK